MDKSDSEIVDGAMRVMQRIFSSLQFEILDFRDAGLNPALETGVRGSTYVNASFRCRIAAPDASWELRESRQEVGTRLLSMKPKKGAAAFALRLFGVPSGAAAQALLEESLKRAEKDFDHYRLLEAGGTDVGPWKASRATFSYNGENGSVMLTRYLLLIDGNRAYLMVWLGTKDEFERSEDVFRRILASFEIVSGPAGTPAGS